MGTRTHGCKAAKLVWPIYLTFIFTAKNVVINLVNDVVVLDRAWVVKLLGEVQTKLFPPPLAVHFYLNFHLTAFTSTVSNSFEVRVFT